jgi:hypothetical protein
MLGLVESEESEFLSIYEERADRDCRNLLDDESLMRNWVLVFMLVL